MTPGRARMLVVVASAVAVAVAAGVRIAGDNAASGDAALHVRYVLSTDADELIVPLVARFNRERHRAGSREIRIDPVPLSSGEAEAAFAARRETAALWTPASSLWGQLLNHDAGSGFVGDRSPSLVSSPQVIAMWKPLAEALGWPDARIGWRDVLALATSDRGWAAYGRPDFGSFRLGHTNPDFSTSGLSAIASEYYAVTGKRSGLTLADVRRPAVRAAVRAIERSVVHYGKTVEALTDQMDLYGEAYAHAVYAQETSLVTFNKGRKHATPLVPIIPSEGTFVADYPLILLDAPWVTREVRAAAAVFRRWLPPRITAEAAQASGFRLRSPSMPRLELPAPEVLAAIRENWHADRKPANIVLVVDTSSSMGGAGRLDAAKQGLLSFLRELTEGDRVALVTSGASVATKVPLEALRLSRPAVARAVRGLFPNGELPVYAAVSRALADARRLRDPERINAVVVLSDGAGTSAGLGSLLQQIRAESPTEGASVRILTVAYGQGANAKPLKAIASASQGAFFPAGPKDIASVYRTISSYF